MDAVIHIDGDPNNNDLGNLRLVKVARVECDECLGTGVWRDYDFGVHERQHWATPCAMCCGEGSVRAEEPECVTE